MQHEENSGIQWYACDFLKGKYVTKCHVYYLYTYYHHRITVGHICVSDFWKLYISMLTFITLDFSNNMYIVHYITNTTTNTMYDK